VEGNTVKADFVATEAHTGYRGIVHGGILSALLDETMGWAPCVRHGRFCLSAELQIRFLKPAPLGRKLIVTGEVVGGNRRLWEARGDIRDENGTVYAQGTGKYVPLSAEETAQVCDVLLFGEDTLTRHELLQGRQPHED